MSSPQGASRRDDREITIADVAREAGVSVSTVSRILNNKPDVAERTRTKVQSVIDEMGFQPLAQAQRLRMGTAQSQTIALLYPLNSHNEQSIDQLHLDFMVGAAAAAGKRNYFFNVVTNPIDELSLLRMYRSQQLDGIILMEILLEDMRVEVLRENSFPFVAIGRARDNAGLVYLDLDLEAAVRLAFDYLVEQGHRKIGYLGYGAQLREAGLGPAIRAWEGYESALDAHRLDRIFREPIYVRQAMYEATLDLLVEAPDLTAIVTMTDAAAAAIFEALRDEGYELPRDFSVIGLAIDRLAEVMTPTMTAIRFPAYEMGYQAAEMLIDLLEGKDIVTSQTIIQPELIIRGSTALRQTG